MFLQVSGYTAVQIAGFGDLARLPDEKMSELLHFKADNAIANALGENLQKPRPRVKKLGGRKRVAACPANFCLVQIIGSVIHFAGLDN